MMVKLTMVLIFPFISYPKYDNHGAKDGKELAAMLKHALHPSLCNSVPRGQIDDFSEISTDYPFTIKASARRKTNPLLRSENGKISYEAAKTKNSHDVAVINARFIKPLDEETILSRCLNAKHIITLEDHVVKGGFGNQVLELLHKNKIAHKNLTILGLPDKFIEHGSNEELFKQYCLSTEDIVKRVQQLVRE